MNADQYNPFPYPPTFLALLAPLGRLSVGAAFALFMVATFALYLAAMAPRRDWRWAVAACLAPGVDRCLDVSPKMYCSFY